MKKISMILAALALALMMVGPVLAQQKSVKAVGQTKAETQGNPQTKCPVLGGNVDKNVYADYKGYRIYFCCKGCDEEFKKNPEKYLEKLKAEGVKLEKAPATGKTGK